MALQLVITNAGRAAVIDQAAGGFRAVRIAAVGVSPTAVNATPATTGLGDEVKRIVTIAGEATATNVTHLTVTDESADSYTVRSFALYLSDGTLFALYGQADPIVQKSAQALLLLSIDIALSDIPAAAITFGNANFTNPAATTDRAGVTRLATDEQHVAGELADRAATPRGLRAVLSYFARLYSDVTFGLVSARGFLAYDDINVGSSWQTGSDNRYWVGASANTFYMGGHGHFFPGINGLVLTSDRFRLGAADIWTAANDGAGSGLDADMLDGRQGADHMGIGMATERWWTSSDTELRFRFGQGSTTYIAGAGPTPIEFRNKAGIPLASFAEGGAFNVAGVIASGGNVVWHVGNDGAGSGMDADLLDGQHGSWYADVPARLGFAPLPAGSYNAFDVLTKLVTVDGAGSGLDADMLDGRQGSDHMGIGMATERWWTSSDVELRFRFAQGATTYLAGAGPTPVEFRNKTGNPIASFFEDGGFNAAGTIASGGNIVWHVANDGAGSGLDADLLDGQHGSWYADVPARLGFAPLAASVYTASDVLAKTLTVDGAGSGLDADLLDGWQRDEVRNWANILDKPASFPAAAHTHSAADIAAAFPGTLSGNGYTVLPNGLILQWLTGAQQGAGSEGTQYAVFPIAFPNACFQVIASTQVANPNTESHATYQLINYSNEGATVMRQLVSTAGADREPSWPRLFAIGR